MSFGRLPKLVLGPPAAAAAVGDMMADSSDQRLWWPKRRSGGELVDTDTVRAVAEGVELLDDRMRKGMRRFERKEVKLSLRLRTELERLCLRGLYDGSGA